MPYKDPEKAKAYHAAYSKQWTLEHKERRLEASRRHYHRNKEQAAQQWKDWYYNKGGREKVREQYVGNPEAERARRLKKKYGISVEQYTKLFEEQEGKCKICGITPMKSLCVDHDHQTGKVRGLLCHQCNCVLGYAKDSVETLTQAIAYLQGA